MNTLAEKKRKCISAFDLFKIFSRSFFIQATFTLMEKLGTGFGFALLPGIRRISRNSKETQQLLKRHTEYFNTHPYLSSFVLGAVLHLEEDTLNDSPVQIRDVANIKTRLAGALGSLGDRFFWKYLKPLASITALILLLVLRDWYPWNVFVSVICFLLLFNIFHIFYRWWGIRQGYKLGAAVIRSKSILMIEPLSFVFSCLSLGLLGILIILESSVVYEASRSGIVILLTAAASSFFFNYKKLSPALGIVAGLTIAAVLYGIFQITLN